MSLIENRIKSYLDKSFGGKIDLDDIKARPESEQKKQFYSRAFSEVWAFCNTLRDDGIGYGDCLNCDFCD